MSVVIETTIGDLTVDLYLKERPNTCLNFLKLCKIKYYNLCLFHKIEKNFIAQSGDPTGSGRGGESMFCHLYGEQAKYFDSEFKPRLKHEKLGTLSMVNNGNNMNGSQFFLTLGENLTYLDEEHAVFGEVVEGFPTLLKLNEAICDDNNRPYQDIRITHTVVLYDPYDDPQGLIIPDASPEPTREQLESGYIAADEEIDDTKGKTAEEIEEKIRESEAKARATILEMVGDIPDADVKPPENVLFVCKLNPVTTSEDLEIIFSRFGLIVSCEVIKDHKTGESLQYAFIEFEKEEDCENAYFKMDNVLIDDRRIHVDFSQSVSKLNWNKDGKISHSKPSKNNVILKSSKEHDGYSLIFDDTPDHDTVKRNKKPKSQNLQKERDEIRNKRHDQNRSRSPPYTHSKSSSNRHRERFRSRSPRPKRDEQQPSDYKRSSYKKYTSAASYDSGRKSDNHDKYSSHKESVSKHSGKSSYSSWEPGKRHDDSKKSSRHQEYSYPKLDKRHHSYEKKSSTKLENQSYRGKQHHQKSSDRSSSSSSPVRKRSKVSDASDKKVKESHKKKSYHKKTAEQSLTSSSSYSESSASESSYEKHRKKSKAKKKRSSKKSKKHH